MRVAVLLSGGVDSSVALHRLHAEGHELHAFYLKIWLEDELAHLGECPWEDDLRVARQVCGDLGVPLEAVSLQREYHQRVVEEAVDELRAGRTPSPDILCNRRVKFGVFFDHLASTGSGFDKVATGHYARVTRDAEGWFRLWKGVDPVKDQTYFLCRLDQHQLGRCLFPLGGLRKSEVRALALELGLPNRNRPDSQGICFLGDLRFDDFVRAYLGERHGEIREVSSERVLGQHRGVWFHTIGQRRGLGLGGGPWYVVAKDIARNVVLVAHGEHVMEHHADRFRVGPVSWIAGIAPSHDVLVSGTLTTKIRHSPSVLEACLEPAGDLSINTGAVPGEAYETTSATAYEVRLARPEPGLATGQEAVFYAGEECLGGARIVDVSLAHESTREHAT